MSEWLTTWEMFSRLKDGEIAVSDDEKVRVRKFGRNSYYQVDWEGNYLCQITLTTSFVEKKWRILPRYVSFEEAMKALMNGKTVWLWQGDEKEAGYYIDKESGELWAIVGDSTAPVNRIWFGDKWAIEE